MKILGLVQKVSDNYSIQRLQQVIEERGDTLDLVNPLDCSIHIGEEHPRVVHESQELSGYDLVLPRCASFTDFGINVVRTMEVAVASNLMMDGAISINDPQAKLRAHNKFFTLQTLTAGGIPIPQTALTWNTEHLTTLVNGDWGIPAVLKVLEGTWGMGVMRSDSIESLISTFEAFQGTGKILLIQRYIRESAGSDLRVIVVGDQVIGAVRRIAPEGEFRANIHRGATAEMVELSSEHKAIAVRSARLLGLEIAGVDMLEAEAGPMVIEVNPAPGFKSIEQAAGVDAAGLIFDYLSDRVIHQ